MVLAVYPHQPFIKVYRQAAGDILFRTGYACGQGGRLGHDFLHRFRYFPKFGCLWTDACDRQNIFYHAQKPVRVLPDIPAEKS